MLRRQRKQADKRVGNSCCHGYRRVKDEAGAQRGAGRALLTAHLEVMSSLTSLLVTSHSRCRNGRGRTLCVGCAQEMWHEVPAQRKSWPEGPADSDLGKGHFPHQSLKRKQEKSGHLSTAEDSLNTRRIYRRRRALQARLTRQCFTESFSLMNFPFCPEEAELHKFITQVHC